MRQIPEVEEVEDEVGCQSPSHTENGKPVAPMPVKASKKRTLSQADSQLLARVCKDACIAYLCEDASVKFCRKPTAAH